MNQWKRSNQKGLREMTSAWAELRTDLSAACAFFSAAFSAFWLASSVFWCFTWGEAVRVRADRRAGDVDRGSTKAERPTG